MPQADVAPKPTQDSSLLYVEDESQIDTLLSEAAVLILLGSYCLYYIDAKWFPTLLQAGTCGAGTLDTEAWTLVFPFQFIFTPPL